MALPAGGTQQAFLSANIKHASPASELMDSTAVESSPDGRYLRYSTLLGRGACKRVFKAFDNEEGIDVAWNQVELVGLEREEEAKERLFAEIRVLQSLHHKNIMSFKEWWYNKDNQTINFITELFTSGTLRQYRKRTRMVSESVIKRWAFQILEGLVYLHGHEPPIVHRDLKCDNIFVNGTTGVVKIGDLGLATAQQGLSVVGTPEFMAPEIYEEQYNEKVDIYSFGMCLLELATLEYPYSECHGVAQIFRKVTQGIPPQALQRVNSEELRALIQLCIAHDAEQRPQARQLLKHPFFESLRMEGQGGSSGHLHSGYASSSGNLSSSGTIPATRSAYSMRLAGIGSSSASRLSLHGPPATSVFGLQQQQQLAHGRSSSAQHLPGMGMTHALQHHPHPQPHLIPLPHVDISSQQHSAPLGPGFRSDGGAGGAMVGSLSSDVVGCSVPGPAVLQHDQPVPSVVASLGPGGVYIAVPPAVPITPTTSLALSPTGIVAAAPEALAAAVAAGAAAELLLQHPALPPLLEVPTTSPTPACLSTAPSAHRQSLDRSSVHQPPPGSDAAAAAGHTAAATAALTAGGGHAAGEGRRAGHQAWLQSHPLASIFAGADEDELDGASEAASGYPEDEAYVPRSINLGSLALHAVTPRTRSLSHGGTPSPGGDGLGGDGDDGGSDDEDEFSLSDESSEEVIIPIDVLRASPGGSGAGARGDAGGSRFESLVHDDDEDGDDERLMRMGLPVSHLAGSMADGGLLGKAPSLAAASGSNGGFSAAVAAAVARAALTPPPSLGGAEQQQQPAASGGRHHVQFAMAAADGSQSSGPNGDQDPLQRPSHRRGQSASRESIDLSNFNRPIAGIIVRVKQCRGNKLYKVPNLMMQTPSKRSNKLKRSTSM